MTTRVRSAINQFVPGQWVVHAGPQVFLVHLQDYSSAFLSPTVTVYGAKRESLREISATS